MGGFQVVPPRDTPRDTLRAVAPARFTLKVSIDRECDQGLRPPAPKFTPGSARPAPAAVAGPDSGGILQLRLPMLHSPQPHIHRLEPDLVDLLHGVQSPDEVLFHGVHGTAGMVGTGGSRARS